MIKVQSKQETFVTFNKLKHLHIHPLLTTLISMVFTIEQTDLNPRCMP